MEEKRLKQILKEFRFEPDQSLFDKTLNGLENYIDVTNSEKPRKPIHIFNIIYNYIMNTSLTKKVIVALAVVIVGGSFALASAANASVPGDDLHGLDISLENLSRSFKFSPKSEAEYEIELLHERAEEFKKLNEMYRDGKIDETTLEAAIAALKAQDEKAQNQVREIGNDDDANGETERERVKDLLETEREDALKALEQLRESYKEMNGQDDEDSADEVDVEDESSDVNETEDGVEVEDSEDVNDSSDDNQGELEQSLEREIERYQGGSDNNDDSSDDEDDSSNESESELEQEEEQENEVEDN